MSYTTFPCFTKVKKYASYFFGTNLADYQLLHIHYEITIVIHYIPLLILFSICCLSVTTCKYSTNTSQQQTIISSQTHRLLSPHEGEGVGYAIGALITGILANVSGLLILLGLAYAGVEFYLLLIPFLLSIAAVILGYMGIRRTTHLRGLAIAGFVLGAMIVVPALFEIFIALLITAFYL